MSERVDKQWMRKGLHEYSTESILGTLGHYGVAVDEAGFKAQAQGGGSPLTIARDWLQGWKGTGQFSHFPAAAAEVLWRRWLPEQPTPGELVEGLVPLLNTLQSQLGGRGTPEAVDEAFGRVEGVLGRVPREDGVLPRRYVEQAFSFFNRELMQAFGAMGERLARAGKGELARRFTALEEQLLPERAGVASAMVLAAEGQREPALEKLREVSAAGQPEERRLFAVDGFIHLGAYAEATPVAESVLDAAEKAEDWHLALDTCARLEHLHQKQSNQEALQALYQRARGLQEAHARAHPGHAHHH